jgi:hypothetical protein
MSLPFLRNRLLSITLARFSLARTPHTGCQSVAELNALRKSEKSLCKVNDSR